MIGAILAGAGALVSAGMAIKNNQDSKAASEAASVYANQLKGMKEVNLMAALQSPDIMKLLNQQTAQQSATATQALQSGGPEAAAQIAALNKQVLDSNAEAATQQEKMNYQRDAAVLSNAQEVENRNIIAQRALVNSQLAGSQKAAANYAKMASKNIEGAISGLGTAAGEIEADVLAYRKRKNPSNSDINNQVGGMVLKGASGVKIPNVATGLESTPQNNINVSNLMSNVSSIDELVQMLKNNPELFDLLSNINK